MPLGGESVTREVPPKPAAQPSVNVAHTHTEESTSTSAASETGGTHAGTKKHHENEPETHPPKEKGKVSTESATPSEKSAKVQTGAAKEHPVVTPAAQTQIVSTSPNIWTADLGFAWYNRYYFRGVDILKQISPQDSNQGVINTKLTLALARQKDAFSIGVGYVQALGRQLPNEAAANAHPNPKVDKGNGQFVPKNDNENFHLPPLSRYEEYDLYLAYTHELITRKLEGTIGFNHYQFSDGSFYGKSGTPIPYADEGILRLDYIGIPHIRPSLAFAKDFDGFHGGYLEGRVDAGWDLYRHRSMSIRIEPYIGVSYDFQYNGSNDGWNALEFGLSMPIRLSDHFSLTLTGNYTKALEKSDGEPRASNGFWGGMVFNVTWGRVTPPPPSRSGKGDEIVTLPAKKGPWEISAGVGWREIDYHFATGTIKPIDPFTVYKRKFRVGQIGLAGGAGVFYDNGAVFSGAPPPISPVDLVGHAGTANFRIASASQVANGQVRFTTNDYGYNYKKDAFSTAANDNDIPAGPYISLNRELWRSGQWSVRGGMQYSFTQSDGDSGVNLARLDSLFERTNKYGFVYSLDQVSTNVTIASFGNKGANFNSASLSFPSYAAVVTNSNMYAASYALTPAAAAQQASNSPQTEFGTSVAEVAKIATFVQTKVSATAHDISFPFSLRRDFGRRLHAEISVAPTLTVLNWDTRTEVDRRLLTDTAPTSNLSGPNARIAITNVAGQTTVAGGIPGIPLPTTGFTQAQPVANPGLVVVAAAPPPSTGKAANLGGKSGANPDAPTLPGKDIGKRVYDDSSTGLRFGVDGTATLIWDLDDEGTFYAEIWGRYHWSDHFTLGGGPGANNANLDGFEAGVGVGMRF